LVRLVSQVKVGLLTHEERFPLHSVYLVAQDISL
jgi:hypothetical protein